MLSIRRTFAAAAFLCALASPALADALRVTAPFGIYAVGDVITDATAVSSILAGPNAGNVTRLTAGTAAPVITPVTKAIAGSGRDFSANAPAIPAVGVSFGSSGPYANFVPVQAIPAYAGRSSVEVDNTSGAPIVIVRDDGTAAAGSAPVNASVIPLAGGATVGSQGGSWANSTFKGRVQIYAPSPSASVTVAVD